MTKILKHTHFAFFYFNFFYFFDCFVCEIFTILSLTICSISARSADVAPSSDNVDDWNILTKKTHQKNIVPFFGIIFDYFLILFIYYIFSFSQKAVHWQSIQFLDYQFYFFVVVQQILGERYLTLKGGLILVHPSPQIHK